LALPSPATTSAGASPLIEVDEKSLESIFATPPSDLSEAEVEKIVEYYQAKRFAFIQTPEGKGEKRAKKVAADDALKLEDLGL
jgi:hypothetical protein